jgi:hypothetical protein
MLHDRLDDLAADAPAGNAAPGELWARGVRRNRVRRVGGVAAVVAAVALVVGTSTFVRIEGSGPLPADAPFAELRLPEVVHAPGTWSDDEGPDGPLAALGVAFRSRPEGLTDERQHLEMFGVSAVDGSAAWIDLPGVDVDDRGLVGWFALSPDGRWIGWSRFQAPRPLSGSAVLLGWAVMDTATGKVREFADPTHPRLRGTVSDLAFSGDSRYLLTSYETPDAPQRKGHQFVAWDVEDATPTVLEEPGERWLPNLGSAPTGVVWSRGRTVHLADPATGERSSYSFAQSVVTASWAPDGTAFAYIGQPAGRSGGPWRLYAGRSLAQARDRPLPLDVEPAQLLGWRDERHVVVGRYRSTVYVVDVVTGDVITHAMSGRGEPLNSPLLAADLWQNPFAAPVEPDATTDPRRPLRWGSGALLAALAGLLVLRRRRARA